VGAKDVSSYGCWGAPVAVQPNDFACGNDAYADGNGATAIGSDATAQGEWATAVGRQSNANGKGAIAVGREAIAKGERSISVGAMSGKDSKGSRNIFIGAESGQNTEGDNNTAVGDLSGTNVFGDENTAFGSNSGNDIGTFPDPQNQADQGTKGSRNSVLGVNSGNHVTGNENSAFGYNSGNWVSGDGNIAFGRGAGNGSSEIPLSANHTVAIGTGSLATGNHGIAIGTQSRARGGNSMALGHGTATNGPGGVAIGADSQGNGAQSLRENHFVLGTQNHTYSAPGITSDESRSFQQGPLQVLTTDAAGNLASDGGLLFEELSKMGGGVAIAMALENPDLVGNERFGLAGNVAFWEDNVALGFTAMGVLGHNFLGTGERWALSGGVGFTVQEESYGGRKSQSSVGGRAGLQVTW